MRKLKKIEDLLPHYDAFLIDIWGVIYNGEETYPGAVEAINNLISQNKKILFLSNTPRPALLTSLRLIEWGINIDRSQVLTSGEMVRRQIQAPQDLIFSSLGTVLYHLGENRNTDILQEINVSKTREIGQADFILLTAYLDEGENLSQYHHLLESALARNLPLVCANPDKEVMHGNKKRYCSGTIAALYEDMGGKVFYYGKPYKDIYVDAIRQIGAMGVNDVRKIIMIGDTLETDVLGAHNAGIDSAVVASGNFYKDYMMHDVAIEHIISKLDIRPKEIIARIGS